MAVPSSSCAATLAKKEYKGWSVYELSNGILSLMIAPDLGGRAIQLQLGDQEFFFVNPALAGKVRLRQKVRNIGNALQASDAVEHRLQR